MLINEPENSNLILIEDLIEAKTRKKMEMEFYEKELAKLHAKMDQLQSEIRLTEKILKMVEQECILDLKKR